MTSVFAKFPCRPADLIQGSQRELGAQATGRGTAADMRPGQHRRRAHVSKRAGRCDLPLPARAAGRTISDRRRLRPCRVRHCATERAAAVSTCRVPLAAWHRLAHTKGQRGRTLDPRNYQYTGGLWADARVVRPGAVRADARRGRAVRAAQQSHLCDAARCGRRRLLAFDDGAANDNASIIAAATAAAVAATRRHAENACAAEAAAADVHARVRRAQLHGEVRQAPSAAVETRGVVVARATSGDAARVLCWLSWYCLGG